MDPIQGRHMQTETLSSTNLDQTWTEQDLMQTKHVTNMVLTLPKSGPNMAQPKQTCTKHNPTEIKHATSTNLTPTKQEPNMT